MRIKNKTKLKHIEIGDVAINTQVLFHNDGLEEDIYTIKFNRDDGKVITIVETPQGAKYDFLHSSKTLCYIYKAAPDKHEVLFNED
jgi:hypothetical protein